MPTITITSGTTLVDATLESQWKAAIPFFLVRGWVCFQTGVG